jgi:hypothetical protein
VSVQNKCRVNKYQQHGCNPSDSTDPWEAKVEEQRLRWWWQRKKQGQQTLTLAATAERRRLWCRCMYRARGLTFWFYRGGRRRGANRPPRSPCPPCPIIASHISWGVHTRPLPALSRDALGGGPSPTHEPQAATCKKGSRAKNALMAHQGPIVRRLAHQWVR